MLCVHCDSVVDEDRLEFLIENNKEVTCCNCTKEIKVVGFMDFNHKTAPQLVLIPPNEPEVLRIAIRAHRRAR